MPTPPVKPTRSSQMSTLRWVRWFCFSGLVSWATLNGLRNHSTWTPQSDMWAISAESIRRPPMASMSTRTRTPSWARSASACANSEAMSPRQ
jgi:hypothetical protein